MIKTMLKFSCYILLKWLCLYTYLLADSESKWDWDKVKTKEDAFYTAWMLFALPIVELLVLFLPFLLALRSEGLKSIVAFSCVFILEFVVGWYATNQHIELWMIIKITFSIVLFLIVYRYKTMSISN